MDSFQEVGGDDDDCWVLRSSRLFLISGQPHNIDLQNTVVDSMGMETTVRYSSIRGL